MDVGSIYVMGRQTPRRPCDHWLPVDHHGHQAQGIVHRTLPVHIRHPCSRRACVPALSPVLVALGSRHEDLWLASTYRYLRDRPGQMQGVR